MNSRPVTYSTLSCGASTFVELWRKKMRDNRQQISSVYSTNFMIKRTITCDNLRK